MTNDKPDLTSEELLRQAREAFDSDQPSTTPVAPPSADVPSATPEAPAWPAADPNETPITSDSLLPSNSPIAPPPGAADVSSGMAPPASAIPEPPKAWAPADSALPPPVASPPSPGPASPPHPGPTAPPRTPSASSGGIDYYAASDNTGPQSYGSAGGFTGASGPPPGLGTPQQRQPRMSQPPMRKSRNLPWRLIIGGGAIAIFAIIGAIANRGTTSANSLSVGDCFENPGFGDFSKVTDQDCALAHDIQIYARIKDVPAALVATTSTDPRSAGVRCEAALESVFTSAAFLDPETIIPDDVVLGWFADTDASRAEDVLCAIESPSGGLVGSVVDS